ncbi:hypothetical protein BS17DRAFT_796921 [Gyrodon lividus]|nr:hypothetical protein BS17DRAFT_796921 [Gyrodon lividus]
MFSTFSSFLPSALQINQEPRFSYTPSTPVNAASTASADPTEPEQCPPVPIEGVTSKKKDKKDKPPNETFIVVRPPPSKSNHPLNLQVQLVPQSRHDRPSATVQALDTNADDALDLASSTDLRRTSSNRSETSTYSGYTSATSISSFASTSTTSSGRRPIIPLYNLQAHNVMTNTIVDAGTDAKVAKFARRGLEVIGLAIFEPIEVWSTAPLPGVLPPTGSTRTSFDDGLREFGLSPRPQTRSPSSRPATPDRSSSGHFPVHAGRELLHKPSINLIPALPQPSPMDAQPQRGAKKLFTRIFKKKDPSRPLSIAPEAGDHAGPLISPLRAAGATARQSQEAPLSEFLHLDTPQLGDGPPSTPMTCTAPTLCPAVLGTQPALYPPITPPKGRPTKYVWVVRKWLKGVEAGLLNGVMEKLSVNGRNDANASGALQVEVRFEWSRGRKKAKGRKGRVDRTLLSASGTGGNGNASRHDSTLVPGQSPSPSIHRTSSQLLSPLGDATPGNHRHSTASQHSTGSDTGTSLDSSAAHRAAEDSGDESDPEDSETPWACAITVQRLGAPPGQRQGHSGTHMIRIKVATLSPTPHHPKVVGLLKMPFPLPDIEIERLAVRRRIVTAQGISKTMSNSGGHVLTAEEIKDTVSSTALWLVVREAFGGVGRERRKGDGWRIRA